MQLGLMGSGAIKFFIIFLFYLCLNSGSSEAELPPAKAIRKEETVESQEDEILFSPSASVAQLDTVPVVNPTTPGMGTTTPIVNPTESPPAPAVPTIPTNPVATPTTSSGGAWCIATPSASDTALQVALDYACGYGGTDCSAIQPSANCYDPNTLRDHASYAFNDYYQKNPIQTSCAFGGTAQLTYTDPSHGNCHYASPKTTTPSISPPATPTPTTTTPNTMIPTTVTPTTFTPPSVYGAGEPTESPSSATDILCSLQVTFSAIGVYGLLLAIYQL